MRGRDAKMVVPIVEIERGWLVQTCEDGLRRKLLWCIWLKRWVWLSGVRCVRYRGFLCD